MKKIKIPTADQVVPKTPLPVSETMKIAYNLIEPVWYWTDPHGNPATAAFNRKVKQCEVRATLDDVSNVTLNLLARTPNNRVWTGSRNFAASQFQTSDVPLRKLCGQRALEAQVQIQVTGGRPTFRSVEIETAVVGRVEE